ncbi:MAG: hypothetical protein OXC80_12410 [Gammaproteobacteria bacterium]|nr:hypothetical protein [Gammaproteobacteria bacterium]
MTQPVDAVGRGDQHTRRVIEREDSESQADGTRIPQHGVVQERHLLPLWGLVNVP